MTLPPNDLPPAAVAAFSTLTDEQRVAFTARYNDKKRSMALMVALAILFPIQLFFLGRILLGILFLLTGGGFGIWFFIEWFLTPRRVREYNARVADETLVLVGSGPAGGSSQSIAEEEE